MFGRYTCGLIEIRCSRSTDFEVHRNWLAITHSLPISQWYYDVSSSSPFIIHLTHADYRQRRNGVRTFVLLLHGHTSNEDFHLSALDYPPFFAYFEKLLSVPAAFIDPEIVDLNNLGYDSWSVIAYQRTTVVLTELVLAAAAPRYVI